MAGSKGGSGTPQTGQGKGAGGTPQGGQGKGAGGQPQQQGGPQAGPGATPPTMAAMQADQQRMSANALQRTGGPQAPRGIAGLKGGGGNSQAQNLMNQYSQQLQQANAQNKAHQGFLANQTAEKNFMAGTGAASMEGLNRADFMPGGRLSASNQVPASMMSSAPPPDPAAAAAKPSPSQMGADALSRMQDSLQSNNTADPGAAKMPNAQNTMSALQKLAGQPQIKPLGGGQQYRQQAGATGGGKGGNKGGGGVPQGGGGQQRQQAGATGGGKGGNKGGSGVPQGSRGQYANGGIVGLANGGQLGRVMGGGVSYGPATAAPPPMAVAAPVQQIAAAPAMAAAPRWTPVAAPAGGGGMFSGIGSLAPVTQPAKFVAPATQQTIWQPPAKVEPASTAGAGLKGQDFIKAILFGAASPEMLSQMSPQQYTDFRMMGMRTGGGSSGSGSDRSGSQSGS